MSDRDEARQRREEARNRRRGQAPESPAEAKQPQDEPQETDGNGGHPTRDSLMSAATVAAAGAAVGAALGAARALTDRDDSAHEDVSDRDHREPEPAADLEPEAEAKSEPAPDETSELRAEPHAEAAPEPELEPTPEPREETPVAGATPDETAEVVRRAREQLRALHGSEPESISSLERTPRGWRATFEVVELERVPDSTDVLASYEVVLDEDRNVTRYARIRRYYRAQADHEERA